MKSLDILNFWFGEPWNQSPVPNPISRRWFRKSAAFDQEIRERFESTWHQCQAGFAETPTENPAACLAGILLTDQFPRNMFRDTAKMFASDPIALQLAKQAVQQGFHLAVPPSQSVFFLMPFEHSEQLEDQDQCLRLFTELIDQHGTNPTLENYRTYAEKHRQIIAQFGRFPHRNVLLGRKNSSTEESFLQEPGSRF